MSFMAIVLFDNIVKFDKKASIWVTHCYLVLFERFSEFGQHVLELVHSHVASVVLIEGSKRVLDGQLAIIFLRHLVDTIEKIVELA